jgi:hypothetical protein
VPQGAGLTFFVLSFLQAPKQLFHVVWNLLLAHLFERFPQAYFIRRCGRDGSFVLSAVNVLHMS